MGNCETRHSRKYSISFSMSRNYAIWFSTFPPLRSPYLASSSEQQPQPPRCRSLEHSPPLIFTNPLSPKPHAVHCQFLSVLPPEPLLFTTVATSLVHIVTITHLNFCNSSQIHLSTFRLPPPLATYPPVCS